VRLTGSSDWGDWLIGLSHVEARQNAVSTLDSLTPGISAVIENDTRSSKESAAFGNVSVPLSAQVTAELGGRLFLSNVRDTRRVSGQSATVEQQRVGVTPSAAIAWNPREGRTLYLRYGSAFRSGGADASASGRPESYNGDELSTIEAGWREQMAGGGNFELGTYYTLWNDMQSDMLLPNGLIETQNAGKARILGAEASLTRPLGGGWDVKLGASVQDALLIRNDLGIKLDGRRLPVVPAYVLRGALERAFTLGGRSGSVRIRLRYVGPSRLSFDPAIDRSMGRVLESGIEGRLALGKFDLSLTAENVLNRSADVFAFGNPFRLATMPQYTPQAPFSVTFAVSRAF
jgi:iron complex outermembrane receptor protein